MEHFPRNTIKLPFESTVRTSYSFDIDKTWSCASCLAKGIKESACWEATQDVFTFQVCFFCWVLELVTSVETLLYLYFQVLWQVLASDDTGTKSCDMLSRKQILSTRRKHSYKITRSSFWSNYFWQHALYNLITNYSSEFFIWATEVPPKN